MITRSFIAALAATSFVHTAAEIFQRKDVLLSNIEKQREIAFQGVLNNIGPNGSQVEGVAAGVVVASPSTQVPDYFYTWTRDAALTMKMLVDEFLHGKKELRSRIQAYLKAQAILQSVSNLSGALNSGIGLGEPKFYTNLTRFNGDWGRPQRDGPALRATALITYAKWLLNTGDSQDAIEADERVWPVVQNDLNYVAQYWNETGFDLWEEVRGSSFFTTAAQHRALVEGTALGKQLGKDVSAYESQAPNVLCFLQTFWNGQHVVANINTEEEGFNRSGVDANTVLASITTFDPKASCDDALFQPCSPRALANLRVYIDSFRSIYTINNNVSNTSAIATGRYPEDVYFEGNPWYLTTLAVAEQLYDAIQQWTTVNTLHIGNTDLAFWRSVYPAAEKGTYGKGHRNFHKLLDAVLDYADNFVRVSLKYTPPSGNLSEQYSRENGTAVSARDLTWSYAAFITMRSSRLAATSDSPQLPSWGAQHAKKNFTQVCKADSIPGIYTPAIKAGAPAGSGGCTRIVTFNVNATTDIGETMYLSGNTTELGNWDFGDAIAGDASEYTDERPLWRFVVEMPASSIVEYQYVRERTDNQIAEEENSRVYWVPECAEGNIGPANATVEDEWMGRGGNGTLF